MKNIHILQQTDKPSRLHEYDFLSPMGLSKEPLQWRLGRNIYITNDAEIKEGDCIICGINIYKASTLNKSVWDISKKIILTTDQDLIKDGVQKIDDEFLEWFVKNPNCERVETIKVPYFDESGYSYLSIIPKEEPKQVWEQIIETCGGKEAFMESAGLKPKQETLEEVKDISYWKKNCEENYITTPISVLRYISELEKRSYSEEDMKKAFCNGGNLDYSVLTSTEVGTKILNKWFKQFKKK
jgi:hypothetical protein